MARTMQPSPRSICTLLAAIFVASCAAPAPQAVQSPQPLPNAGARPDFGKVVSIRPITFQPSQTAEIAGVNAVLTALGQDVVVPPVTGEEIVIQKDDGNPAALGQQSQSPSPEIGQRVVVVQGMPMAIIARN